MPRKYRHISDYEKEIIKMYELKYHSAFVISDWSVLVLVHRHPPLFAKMHRTLIQVYHTRPSFATQH